MEKLISFLAKNLISVLGITILTGATVATSAMGVAKVANSFTTADLEVPHGQIEGASSSSAVSSADSSAFAGGASSASSVSVAGTMGSAGGSANTNNQCIITLSGNQYDVTSLKTSHSGGDIFTCGTDMTAVYQGKHGSNLSRMSQYLISSNSTGNSTVISSSGGSSTGSSASSIKREDDEHENEKRSENRNEDHEEEGEIESE
ncbi:hypothetical protein COY90_03045 [Candidatus Roizmanbacteria bacterium CG_4_10_14_0_8_um_filter_39_9]|uniref:Cytochrome b5 heme-binding domain-containing protein n=1 Tax=Candidatus Roizmanbacteria bacterium CG_4_10_14_0_8_um_filter_39_9 TaxID=1974829 RepID=A0A2M7QDP1_9BACT|nr:MAG: hypothetical protein COY90_03045 [Candidatus Roizmanbacteria bacterium CG_4_10_14_0_8_um_filter_39_9]